MSFALDGRLEADTLFVGDLALSRALVMNDSRWPWLILVPRRAGAIELTDLDLADRALLIDEAARVADWLKAHATADKINVAALGNIVRQLHLHVVARTAGDPAWPGPVWGFGRPVPYEGAKARALIEAARRALGVSPSTPQRRKPGMRGDEDGRARRIEAIAREAFELFRTGRQVSPFAGRYPGFDLGEAYCVAARLRDLRAARGERATGRKIGFTNPVVQRLYGVHGPIWNFMFDSTVHDLEAIGGRLSLEGLPEPRIEPEIVLHLAAAPKPDMDDEALLACVDWVAHGFEIVQSIFPGWRFSAADSVAGYGLHGAYCIGPKHLIGDDRRGWARALSDFSIELSGGGGLVLEGRAANVLGGPMKALRHLVLELASSAPDESLRPGELVTTGTLTDAPPVAAGQTWSTSLEGVPLEGVRLDLR